MSENATTRLATDEERAEGYEKRGKVYIDVAFEEGMEKVQDEVIRMGGYNLRMATLLRQAETPARTRSTTAVIGMMQDSRERLRSAGFLALVNETFTRLANSKSY